MLTGVFRASYAYVFEPQVPRDGKGEAKYQVTMLVPKSDTATYQAMQAEISRALQEGVQKVFGGQMPARPKTPLYDGDGVKDSGEPFGEECRGHWVVRASSRNRPAVVDREIRPIIDPSGFYSGCYARATVSFYAFNQNGNRGVGCGLNSIQKIADGEPLSGRTTPEEDFGGANAWNGPSTYGMQFQDHPGQPPQAGYGQGYPAAQGYAPSPAQTPPGGGQPAPGCPPSLPPAPAGSGQTPQGYVPAPPPAPGCGLADQGYGPQLSPAPGYSPAAQGYPPARPPYPGYGQPAPAQPAPGYPPAPASGYPAVDPVTGQPFNGGVMGI